MKSILYACTALIAVPATAQTTPPPTIPSQASTADQSDRLEDIVVTAQRRSENLQNVPIAITAVTTQQLTQSNVSGVLDLKIAVPALNSTSTAGYLTSSLRGVGSNAFAQGVESPIALYVDGVYYASGQASALTLNNIAQIEVLKGPQGTLFGRNATGGLIQVTTLDPTQNVTGRFSAGYANYDTFTGAAYLAGGLAPNLRADIAVAGTHQGQGWGTNLFNGRDVYRNDHDISARSKFVFEPSSETKLTLIGDYFSRLNSFGAYTSAPGAPIVSRLPGQAVPATSPDLGYDVNTNVQPRTESRGHGVSGRIDQSLGSVKLMSLTAYRESIVDNAIDYDGYQQEAESVIIHGKDRQFSQELQLSSAATGRFNWVAGLFYFSGSSGYSPFHLNFPDQSVLITINGRTTIKSYAGYGQGNYKIDDKTKLSIGLRYTDEDRAVTDGTKSVFIIPRGISVPTTFPYVSKTFRKLTYRASLDHRFSDEVLTYASYNRGFKSGGFTASAPDRPSYRPETIDAFETGMKTDLLDHTLRMNVAGFYYNYRDVQVQRNAGGAVVIVNGASAHIYGMDADFELRATRDLRLSGGVSLVHPNFKSFPNCPVGSAQGGTPVDNNGNCDGNLLPLSSKFTANAAATYTRQVGNGKLTLAGNLYYNSGFFLEVDNAVKQPHYAQLGATAKYEWNNGLSLGLFGKNLTDRRVLNFLITSPNGQRIVYYQAPRTYGVTLGYHF